MDTKKGALRYNIRQVHLIQSELFGEDFHGHDGGRVQPGQLGENITIVGIDLLSLGKGTKLHFIDESESKPEEFDAGPNHFPDYISGASFFVVLAAALVLRIGKMGSAIAVAVHAAACFILRLLVARSKASDNQVVVAELTGLQIPCKKIDEFWEVLKDK